MSASTGSERPYSLADREAASAYWYQEIRPTLGNLPIDGLRLLRNRYVEDVKANPEALAQLRAWVAGKGSAS